MVTLCLSLAAVLCCSPHYFCTYISLQILEQKRAYHLSTITNPAIMIYLPYQCSIFQVACFFNLVALIQLKLHCMKMLLKLFISVMLYRLTTQKVLQSTCRPTQFSPTASSAISFSNTSLKEKRGIYISILFLVLFWGFIN